ncbi:MAG: hypothetical protein IPL62_18335 [Caulobacteraceae bacterium]|nr:hypothetical protein [Caulobacteraceae bacterium]
MFFYDSEEHQSSRDFRLSLVGNAPIIVDRADGSIHPTGTAHPISIISKYRRKREGSDASDCFLAYPDIITRS